MQRGTCIIPVHTLSNLHITFVVVISRNFLNKQILSVTYGFDSKPSIEQYAETILYLLQHTPGLFEAAVHKRQYWRKIKREFADSI